MWERFEVVGIYQVPVSIEHAPLAFDAGRRSVALQVMNDLLHYCPELYDRMTVENRNRIRQEKTETDQEADQ